MGKRGREEQSVLESVAARCRDSISGALFVDPVIAEDGHTYERRAILEWFRRRCPAVSPLTKEQMGPRLKQNYALKAIVEDLEQVLPKQERAEWYLSKGKLLFETDEVKNRQRPDMRAARMHFDKAALLADGDVEKEAVLCRDICDALMNVAKLRDKAKSAGIDVAWARDVVAAPARGVRLSTFHRLARGTRLKVIDDRNAVLDAFMAQDDVLGLPDDWEDSLGQDFVLEHVDSSDSTYFIVRPHDYDAHPVSADLHKDGRWWPFSVLLLLP